MSNDPSDVLKKLQNPKTVFSDFVGHAAIQAGAAGIILEQGRTRARYMRDIYASQKQMYLRQADYLRDLAEKEVALYDIQAQEERGAMVAQYAARGVRVTKSGDTPLFAVAQAKSRAAFNKMYMRHQRFAEARRFEDQALQAQASGDYAAFSTMQDAYTKTLGSWSTGAGLMGVGRKLYEGWNPMASAVKSYAREVIAEGFDYGT